MKINRSKFYYIIIYLLGEMYAYAAPHPPSPGAKKPVTPPGLSIDNEILLLFAIAFLYGIYIILKHQSKLKTPFM